MMDPAGLQVPAITQNTRTFPIADRLQQDPVDFVPWLKRVRRHAAKQNSLFRDGNLYMNKDNRPAGTPPFPAVFYNHGEKLSPVARHAVRV